MTALTPEALPATVSAEATVATVEERLDRMSLLMQEMYAELQEQRRARERWQELNEVMVPVTRAAFESVSRELEDLSDDVTIDDAIRFARTAARALPQMETLLVQLESMTELGQELTRLSGAAMGTLSDTLAEAERKGYFAFARGGAQIADKVVTSFGEDDVRALGDNVVLILDTVRQMTQPEIMTMLRRTMVTAQADQASDTTPPSLLALLREMRDPQVRRGLGRALHMLRSIGVESRPDQITRA